MKRAVIFAHFDVDGLVAPYVEFLLKSIRPCAHKLIFVSTSATVSELERLSSSCDIAISRENIGYDFMSWKIGLRYIDDRSQYDEIVFINDSVYGPTSDLSHLFHTLEEQSCDFWGLSRCHQYGAHVQSYFFSFRRKLIADDLFTNFWDSVTALPNKNSIICQYEIGLSQQIENAGYKSFVVFDSKSLSFWQRLIAAFVNGSAHQRSLGHTIRLNIKNRRATNPTHRFWRSLIEAGVPFIKVELMRSNPQKMDLARIKSYIAKHTTYDLRLIENHVLRTRQQSTVD